MKHYSISVCGSSYTLVGSSCMKMVEAPAPHTPVGDSHMDDECEPHFGKGSPAHLNDQEIFNQAQSALAMLDKLDFDGSLLVVPSVPGKCLLNKTDMFDSTCTEADSFFCYQNGKE